MKKIITTTSVLVAFVLAIVVFALNLVLLPSDHMVIALNLSNDNNKWYTHRALSKFIYLKIDVNDCDLKGTVEYKSVYMKNAKLNFLLMILEKEYNEGWGQEIDVSLLKSLIKITSNNCNPNIYSRHTGFGKFPPLLYAVFSRQKDVVKLLIDAGANPDLEIDAPGSKMNGLSILEFAYKVRDAAKTDKDKENLNEIINILSNGRRTVFINPKSREH
jgi:ankyrin repeat protein